MNDIFYERKSGNTVRSLWRWAGALCIPAALSVLFQLLHGKRAVMNFWVFHVMGPGERLLGRLWSLVPFSVMEWSIALFLAGNLVWLVRAVAGLVRRRGLGRSFRRLLALGAAVAVVRLLLDVAGGLLCRHLRPAQRSFRPGLLGGGPGRRDLLFRPKRR